MKVIAGVCIIIAVTLYAFFITFVSFQMMVCL